MLLLLLFPHSCNFCLRSLRPNWAEQQAKRTAGRPALVRLVRRTCFLVCALPADRASERARAQLARSLACSLSEGPKLILARRVH